jgi:hypothetical protein
MAVTRAIFMSGPRFAWEFGLVYAI